MFSSLIRSVAKPAGILAIIAGLWLAGGGAVCAQTLYGLADDCEVQFTAGTPPYAIADLTNSTLLAGTGGGGVAPFKERCPVFVFQLPSLGAVTNPFASASFSFYHSGNNGSPAGNLDLYGVGRRAAATVLTNDFWTATSAVDATDAALIEDNLLPSASTAFGVRSNSIAGGAALRNYLNAQYASGAGAGEFVFLRLSSDAPQTAGSFRYNLTASEGGVSGPPDTRPQINYSVDAGPVDPPTNSVPPTNSSVIAAEDFERLNLGALIGQGASGYGWAGGWAAGASGSLNASVAADSTFYAVLNGPLIGGYQGVQVSSGGTETPIAARQLSVSLTDTVYAGCVMRLQGGDFNTGDTIGVCLNNNAASLADGVNFGLRGDTSSGAYFFLRRGTGTPPTGPRMSSFVGDDNVPHWLVIKVQKTGAGNFNKVTLWIDPDAGAETNRPNGDTQLLTDLGIANITQVSLLGQSLDSDDVAKFDGLVLAKNFAALFATGSFGADTRAAMAQIQVEAAADGSSNAPVSAQTIAPGQSLTNFAIVRAANGSFVTNAPMMWKLADITGGILERDLVMSADGRSAVFRGNGAGSARIYAVGNSTNLTPSGLITVTSLTSSNSVGRPFIWTRMSERDGILSRIRTHSWANAQFNLLRNRADGAVAAHQADRSGYLRQLPLNTTTGVPEFDQTTTEANDGPLLSVYSRAQDSAAMYYLTREDKYARYAADVLHNAVLAYVNVTPMSGTTAGYIYSSGLLGEAANSAMYLPVVYDYLYDYLKSGPQVFQLQTTGGADVTYTATAIANAQTVFRTFYQLTRDRGYANNNWSPNEAKSLVPCVLALDSASERTESLKDYLTRDNSRQTSLKTDATKYPYPGSIWPESLDYSEAVNTIHPYLMMMVDRYDPSLNLFTLYPNIALSMARPFQLVYPHGLQIHFGDFHHDDDPQPWFEYELVYAHAQARNLPDLREFYGPLLNAGIAQSKHNRSGDLKNNPLPLLWFAGEINESAQGVELPRGDTLPHAGIALQRNLSTTGNSVDGLMFFVGGAAHVHSHANGMNMELYGEGEVLGAEGGRGDYGSALHENYYRLFAAHNTIIVNGASRGENDWAGIGINTVQVVDMEPKAWAAAVSPDISFTCTSFADDRGTPAEAMQQRTLALVRTSPTTGYYVDLFRSKSTVTNQVATTLNGNITNQFHDYIYHNVGNTLDVKTNGVALPLIAQPARFQNDIGDSYQQPGWRYFTNTVVSYPHAQPVRAQYNYGGIYMDVHLPAVTNREYAKCDAPGIIIPPFVGTKPAPVLAVRQIGDAWDKPFAVVFEPHQGAATSGTVTNVTTLLRSNIVVGLKVQSVVSGQPRTQYVLSNPNANETYSDPALGLSFTGRFAVVTDKGSNTGSLYLGTGSTLSYRGWTVASVGGTNTQANVDFALGSAPVVTANSPVNVSVPAAPNFTQITWQTNGVISLTATGSVGVPYRLWSCTNLSLGSWTPMAQGSVSNSPFVLQDAEAMNQAARFYRFSTP